MDIDPCPLCLSKTSEERKEQKLSSLLKLVRGDDVAVPGADDEAILLCPACNNRVDFATTISNSICELQIKLKSEVDNIRSILLVSESTFGENGNELNENILKIRKSLVETSGNEGNTSELELESAQLKMDDNAVNNFYDGERIKFLFLIQPVATYEIRIEDLENSKEISDEKLASYSEENLPEPKQRRIDDNQSCSSTFIEDSKKEKIIKPRNNQAIAKKANRKVLDKQIKTVTRKRENGADVKMFICPVCNWEFRRRAILANHLLKQHETEDKPFACSKCDKKYTQKLNLERHLEFHQFDKGKPLACDKCEHRFEDNEALKLHISSTHAKILSCPICSKTYRGRQNFLRHKRLHSGEKPFKCKQCNATFVDHQLRKLHTEKFHRTDEKHCCNLCAKIFITSKGLGIHCRKFHSESGGFNINCEEPGCGAKFKYKDTLEGHQIKVHGKDPLTCDKCGSHFMHERKLRSHKKLAHEGTGEKLKNFKCEICGTIFGQISYLKIHKILIHTTERPFVCSVCGNAFKLKSHMKTHEKRMHSGDYAPSLNFTCSHCEKKFQYKNTMEGHIRQVHTGERPFVCHFENCNHKYALRHQLTYHLKKSHGIIGNLKSDRAPRTKRVFQQNLQM